MNKKDKKIKMIDLFSGAGGLTWGFFKNNFSPVETIEFCPKALDTYNYNFKTNALPQDVTDKNVINSITKKWKNNVDIIIGGFPCQGYSLAGKRNPDDPRNQLYKYTIEIIDKVKPKIFLLENVKGILSMENGRVIDKIIKSLKEKNYYCNFLLVNSQNFGVPQKRERIIFIGSSLKNKIKVDKILDLLSKHIEKKITVMDSIGDLMNKKENFLPNHIFTNHTLEMIEKIKNTKQGESVYKNFSDGWRRLYENKPSPTVKENHGGVFIHPNLNRCLTPRELARLQSFPDDFIFRCNKSNTLKQIGNAVPPKMSYEIAKIIKKVFFYE